MTGRGIDQVLPHPGDPRLYEPDMHSATDYVALAEKANGPIPAPSPSTMSGAMRLMISGNGNRTRASSIWRPR